MGEIIKRGNVWWIRWYHEGTRYAESTKSTRRKDAVALLKDREGDARKGIVVTPQDSKVTCGDAFDAVITHYEVKGRRSLNDLRIRVEKHLRPALGALRLSAITTATLEQYAADRLKADAAPATVNRELAVIKLAFRLALRSRRIGVAPYVTMLQEQNVRQGFLEERDVEAVCEHLSPTTAAVVQFAFETGWRIPSEVLMLEWRQVDFAARTVRLEPGTTKNGQGRVFPFAAGSKIERLLLDRRTKTDDVQRREGKLIARVFHRGGEPVTTFRKAWAKACVAAGIPGRIPHDLRRSAVRRMERVGVPRSQAMKLTGHLTESVYRRYAIVSESDLREATAKLDPGTRLPKAI